MVINRIQQPPCERGNISKSIPDGWERIGGKPREFYGITDGMVVERKPFERLSGREVYRIH